MADQMSKAELVALVERIMTAAGSEAELDSMLVLLSASVPHPDVSRLIFYPEGPEPTAELVVEQALSYQAIVLGHEPGH